MSSIENKEKTTKVISKEKREVVWDTTKTVVVVVGVIEIFIAIRLLFGPIMPLINPQIVTRNGMGVYNPIERSVERNTNDNLNSRGGERGSKMNNQTPRLR